MSGRVCKGSIGAALSLLQPAPADTLQDTAEPHSQDAGTCLEMYSRKSKMLPGKVRKKTVTNRPADTKIREGGGEEGAPGT